MMCLQINKKKRKMKNKRKKNKRGKMLQSGKFLGCLFKIK